MFMMEAGWFTDLDQIVLPVLGAPDLSVKAHWGNVWQRHINVDDMLYGLSAGISFDIQNNVLYLGSGYSRDGDLRFYLRLGTGF